VGGGQKVLSRPSADSFAVGRRQKTLCVKVIVDSMHLHISGSLPQILVLSTSFIACLGGRVDPSVRAWPFFARSAYAKHKKGRG
jgi:hypothetical protein